MGKQTTAGIQSMTVRDFTGGWNPRMSPLMLGDGQQAPMQTPDARNCDFSYPGAVSKRLGDVVVTTQVSPTYTWAAQTLYGTAVTPGILNPGATTQIACCQKIVAPANVNVSTATFYDGNILGGVTTLILPYYLQIRADNSGSPGAQIPNGLCVESSGSLDNFPLTFNFATPPQLVAGATYWFCLVIAPGAQTGQMDLTTSGNGSSSSGRVVSSVDGFTTFQSVALADLYYSITGKIYSAPIQGLYDLRIGTGTITQSIIAAMGGYLFAGPPGSSLTQICAGLANGQNLPYDFVTNSNYLFSCDYATSYNQVWDGVSSNTMPHGYRMSPGYVAAGTPTAATIASMAGSVLTMNANQPASGLYFGKLIWLTGGATAFPEQGVISSFTTSGTPGTSTYYVTAITLQSAPQQSDRTTVAWNGCKLVAAATGGALTATSGITTYKFIAITALNSGGFRCSDEMSVDVPVGTAGKITVSNIAMNSSANGTQFAFDVSPGATVWYIAGPFNPLLQPTDTASGDSQLYYRINAASLSTSLNPMTNATTTFAMTGAIPAVTNNTPLIDTGYAQGFFTSQIDAPRAKYLINWQNMIVSAGDPNGSSNLWFTPLGMPNVYSTAGGILGANFPVPDTNDGQIIRGLHVWQNCLYVFKNQSVYRIIFTGQTGTTPFYLMPLMGQIGCLSHWSIQESDQGIVFLSVQGPAVCYGSMVQMLPAGKNIINYFQAADPNAFNLDQMIYSQGLLYEAKKQIWWSVASNGSSINDLILIYDYEKQIFWLNDGPPSSYLATIGDVEDFPQPWSGDYASTILHHDTGNADEVFGAIEWYYSTPWLSMGDPFAEKELVNLYVSGVQQTASAGLGQLTATIYFDFNVTPYTVVTFDMTSPDFTVGGRTQIQKPGGRFKYIRIVFSNYDLGVPTVVQAMRIDWQLQGVEA